MAAFGHKLIIYSPFTRGAGILYTPFPLLIGTVCIRIPAAITVAAGKEEEEEVLEEEEEGEERREGLHLNATVMRMARGSVGSISAVNCVTGLLRMRPWDR